MLKNTTNMLNENKLSEVLKSYLLRKGYKPGERIETEHELATLFGVSRYRVRYVLGALVQQGILKKYPKKGTFIRHFDIETLSNNLQFTYKISNFDLNEYIEARIVVEMAVMPLVIKRITPSQITQIEESVDRMLRNRNVPEKADKNDLDFHLALLQSCGNKLLSSFTTVLSTLFHDSEYRRKYWKPEIITRLANEHRLILEAITQGDLDLAVERLNNHLHYKRKIERDGKA